MIGLDTNVLLRLAAGDDQDQADAAASALESTPGMAFVVNAVVLAEFVWVLRSSYRMSRTGIAAALDALFLLEGVVVLDESVVRQALAEYRGDGSADFADHLIAALNRAAGATHTLTFDRDAAAQPGFALIADGAA